METKNSSITTNTNNISYLNDTTAKNSTSTIGNNSHHVLGLVNLPSPFLSKTYDMVDDPHTNAIISWSPTSKSFVVWEPWSFSRFLLPHFFKHNNFSSFVRQLHTYGFRKTHRDRWEFASKGFVRGQKHLLATIQRRHKASPSTKKDDTLLQYPDKNTTNGFRDLPTKQRNNIPYDLESFQTDNNSIMSEVIKLHHAHQDTLQYVQSISERLHSMELLQQQMATIFSQLLSTLNQICSGDNGRTSCQEQRTMDPADIGDPCFPSSQCVVEEMEPYALNVENDLRGMCPTSSKNMIQSNINNCDPIEVHGSRFFIQMQGPKYQEGKMLNSPPSQSMKSSRLKCDDFFMDEKLSYINQQQYLRAYECDSNMMNPIVNSYPLYDEDEDM